MAIDEQKIREFLLGTASERDEEAIGLRLMSDESFAAELDLAENELIEDHLDGLLSAREKALFHTNFLTTPERRRHLDEVKLLRSAVRTPPARAAKAAGTAVARVSLFAFLLRPMYAAAVVLMLVLAGAALWFTLVHESRSPLEVEYAALNRRDLFAPAGTEGLSSISLTASNFRGSSPATAAYPAASLTDQVVFRLPLPAPEPDRSELQITIERADSPIFTVPGQVQTGYYGSELRFIAPKEILSPARYTVVARSADGRSVKGTFQFRIE